MRQLLLILKLTIISLSTFTLFISFVDAKETISGFCCYNDNIVATSEAQCKQMKGTYFKTRGDARKNCKVAVNAPVSLNYIYCCQKGTVEKMAFNKCKGKPYKTEAEAKKYCQTTKVFCCIDGTVSKTSPEKCKKHRAKAFRSKAEADRNCQPAKVFCCLDGTVRKMSAADCEKGKGRSYKTEREARQNCGWCCAENEVLPTSPAECRNVSGNHYSSRIRAVQECNVQEQCCNNGKLFPYPREKCQKEKGQYYNSALEAKSRCRKAGNKLPDLEVVKTSTNNQCFLTVKVKNAGGPIQATAHAAAEIHISAGPGLVFSKTKLIEIDPGGALRLPGGEITETTDLRITRANQASLVWIDTNHAITESDEINNGDDALVTCKTRLVWCCVNKQTPLFGRKTQTRVGLSTQAECRKLGGTKHKNETDANAACGIDSRDTGKPESTKTAMASSSGTILRKSLFASFGFIHPRTNETFTSTAPLFSWRPHRRAEKYFIRIMKNDGSGPGSHRTIWDQDNIVGTSIVYNSDGSADEPLMAGQSYRANLYARYNSQTGIPNTDTDEFIEMTGDVEFSIGMGVTGAPTSSMLARIHEGYCCQNGLVAERGEADCHDAGGLWFSWDSRDRAEGWCNDLKIKWKSPVKDRVYSRGGTIPVEIFVVEGTGSLARLQLHRNDGYEGITWSWTASKAPSPDRTGRIQFDLPVPAVPESSTYWLRAEFYVDGGIEPVYDNGGSPWFTINNRDLSGGPLKSSQQKTEDEPSAGMKKLPNKMMPKQSQELDRSRQLSDIDIGARRVIPESVDHAMAEASPLPQPEFPARITGINCPIIIGEELEITGHGFGRNRGSVDIVSGPGEVYPCEIAAGDWNVDSVRCSMPHDLISSFGRAAKEAVVWLKPARVEPPDPGTMRDPGGSGEAPYYYNGNEGPRTICEIEPLPSSCLGVDLVLHKIEVRRSAISGCVAKALMSQGCVGRTTVESFYDFTDGSDNAPAGWTIPSGWQGPTLPFESGWLALGCGTITATVDVNEVETETNERNNQCSVTIREGEEVASRTCHPF